MWWSTYSLVLSKARCTHRLNEISERLVSLSLIAGFWQKKGRLSSVTVHAVMPQKDLVCRAISSHWRAVLFSATAGYAPEWRIWSKSGGGSKGRATEAEEEKEEVRRSREVRLASKSSAFHPLSPLDLHCIQNKKALLNTSACSCSLTIPMRLCTFQCLKWTLRALRSTQSNNMGRTRI